jgi:hypothetical protein
MVAMASLIGRNPRPSNARISPSDVVRDALTCRDAAVCVQIRLSAAERRLYVYGDGFLVTSTLLGIEHSTDQDNAVDEGDDLGLG